MGYACTYSAGRRGQQPCDCHPDGWGATHHKGFWGAICLDGSFRILYSDGIGEQKNGRDTKEKYGARIWEERRELWQYLKELVLRS